MNTDSRSEDFFCLVFFQQQKAKKNKQKTPSPKYPSLMWDLLKHKYSQTHEFSNIYLHILLDM